VGTSINIEKTRLGRIRRAADILNITETELLSRLIEKSRNIFGNMSVIKKTVKYQRDYDPADYVIHHVEFADVDYEFAVGRRYFFKISVSFLIRLAIDHYLDEIIREWTEKPAEAAAARERYLTNFHYKNFKIHYKIGNRAEFRLVPWPRE